MKLAVQTVALATNSLHDNKSSATLSTVGPGCIVRGTLRCRHTAHRALKCTLSLKCVSSIENGSIFNIGLNILDRDKHHNI